MKTAQEDKVVDICKFAFSLSIVICHLKTGGLFHAVHGFGKVYWAYYNVVNRCIVPVFFILSGYYQGIQNHHCKSNWNSAGISKYEKSLVRLYVMWTIIYCPYIIANHTFIEFLQRFVFYGPVNHLWYLSSLLVGMFCLRHGYKEGKERKLFMIGIGLYALGWMARFCEDVKMVELYLKIFITFGNGIFFGLLFILIGFIMGKNKGTNDGHLRLILPLLLISLLLLGTEAFLYERYDNQESLFFIMLVPSAVFITHMIIVINHKLSCLVRCETYALRKISTVVYCSHMWGVYMLSFFLPKANASAKMCATILTTVAWCAVVLRFMRKKDCRL